MAERKSSFILYLDNIAQWNMLTDGQAGTLIKALFAYVQNGEQFRSEDGMLRMAFSFIAAQIDRDAEKYSDTCKKRAANVKKRYQMQEQDTNAEAEVQNLQMYTNVENEVQNLQMNTNVPDNDNENENDNDNESVNVNDNGGCAAPAPALGRYGNVCLSENDRKNLCSEYGEETVSRAVEEISEYCASSGKSYKNWSAAIRRWIKRDAKTAAPAAAPKPRPFYHPADAPSYDLDEWMKTALSLPELWKETE